VHALYGKDCFYLRRGGMVLFRQIFFRVFIKQGLAGLRTEGVFFIFIYRYRCPCIGYYSHAAYGVFHVSLPVFRGRGLL